MVDGRRLDEELAKYDDVALLSVFDLDEQYRIDGDTGVVVHLQRSSVAECRRPISSHNLYVAFAWVVTKLGAPKLH